jgi:2-dehydro-3-deoxyphosphogluconate aldolase / (4S)-4-hydroxy-2-oxoglutarate aldolase
VFTQLVKYCRVQMPELAIGVGSVVDGASASMYMALGADFIITPVLREDVAIVCNRRKVLWSPGCGSLSDIARAEELGCEIVKLFPGDVYGPKMVKAIKGPQPWTSIMPTGGVTLEKENLKSWFDAGVTCVGIGSQLVSKSIIEHKDYTTLEENVRLTLKTIKELRK